MARERGLWTAGKKESMGICFVGQVSIREFLGQYLELVPGDIIDRDTGAVVGQHDSALLYTIGQRHGLSVGGGLPYYVVGKDIATNVVYVSQNLNDETMWRTQIELGDVQWIGQPPQPEDTLTVRLRHRGELRPCQLDGHSLQLASPERAVAAGQSAVIYRGEEVLGGGIVL